MPRACTEKIIKLFKISPSENGPIGKNNRASKINIPYLSIDKYELAKSSGRIDAKTLLPSSGGIGIKLRIASIRL